MTGFATAIQAIAHIPSVDLTEHCYRLEDGGMVKSAIAIYIEPL